MPKVVFTCEAASTPFHVQYKDKQGEWRDCWIYQSPSDTQAVYGNKMLATDYAKLYSRRFNCDTRVIDVS